MYFRYTSGKWENYERLGIICNEERGIAQVYNAGWDKAYCQSTPEGEANAQLIASAPEMCEALEDCAELLEQLEAWQNEELDEAFPEIPCLLEKIDGILRQAGGYTK